VAIIAIRLPNERSNLLITALVFGVIGATLIALAPAKPSTEPKAVVGA
jgi:hypothetical protein